jgi:AGZA family xanthine/uracil permease-like MFS transporter
MMKPFVKGDIDGVFALSLDNLLMLILMSKLCLGFLGFSPELFYGKVLPATAVGLVIGNVFYALQALRLARKEGRADVCALPYGVNLLTVFVYVFLVMYPAKQIALGQGLPVEEANRMAWQAGLVACIGSGLIEFFGAFCVRWIRRVTPRAALLAALGGIGLVFIGMDFVFRAFHFPLVGLSTLAITLLVYFGGVKFKWGLPAGLVILAVGVALSWATGLAPVGELGALHAGLYLPLPVFADLWASGKFLLPYLPVILPMGMINLVLSLQNIESAAAAGDSYDERPALMFNGLGTLGAALFGSPFPTTIYIGHPGWKMLGARAGYSTANAFIMSVICLTGTLGFVTYAVPIEAGMAILIWIGVMMCSQAFQVTPARHTPAVVMGLLPALAAFAALMMKHALFAGGYGVERPFTEEIFAKILATRDFYAEGVFALEQGYVYTCMIFAAATVAIIDRKLGVAAIWFLVAAGLTFLGFIHTYAFGFADVVGRLCPALEWFWQRNAVVPGTEPAPFPWAQLKWIWGYLAMAGILLAARFLTVPLKEGETAAPL